MSQKENTLYVRFLGAFSVSWNGDTILGDIRSGETQFDCLMQMLLHARDKGVDQAQLREELFQGREIKNAAHSLSVLLYNARKRLRELGLPDGVYIERRQGRFYWTPEIPVVEDAAEFEAMYWAAESLPEGEDRLPLYLAACELYAGDFLPLRAEKQYVRLEELGRYAARVEPLADWEQLTMEALIGLGRREEAERFYRQTELRYYRELRIRPDRRMLDLREEIAAAGRPSQDMLEALQERLSGTDGNRARSCAAIRCLRACTG